MKKKLRNIVVDGEKYLWRFSSTYENDIINAALQCHDTFVAYREGMRQSPFEIHFTVSGDPIMGDPLKVGTDLKGNQGPHLHTPRYAELLIRYALKNGWTPMTSKKPFIIEDGNSVLSNLSRKE